MKLKLDKIDYKGICRAKNIATILVSDTIERNVTYQVGVETVDLLWRLLRTRVVDKVYDDTHKQVCSR